MDFHSSFLSRVLKQVACLLILGVWVSNSPAAEGLTAGAATVDITPTSPMPMWGYADRHAEPSEGVKDRLMARAVVLGVGDKKLAIVALDLGRAPTRDSMARIREAVAKLGVGEVMLVASHTHHGPVLELPDSPDKKKPYVRDLERKLISVVGSALKNAAPARAGVASSEVPWNRNRHSRLPDPPVDPELLVMRVETPEGKPIAHLVNFAAHPTMLPSKLFRFSPDYPGEMCGEVSKETGVPCLFLQGAAGDLSVNPPEGNRSTEEFGKLLAEKVIAINDSIKVSDHEKHTLAYQRDTFQFRPRLDLKNVYIRQMLNRAFFPEMIAFYEREYREGVRPVLTTAVFNGEIGFVGVSGELFCAHGLRLKRRARLKHLFVLGYCNDYQQYFPTIEASAEGGYGSVPPVATAEIGAGERMMDRALIRLYEMRGELRE